MSTSAVSATVAVPTAQSGTPANAVQGHHRHHGHKGGGASEAGGTSPLDALLQTTSSDSTPPAPGVNGTGSVINTQA
jgi:hypothetical protein